MIIRKLNKTQECTCTANLMKLGIGKSSPVPYLLISTIVLIVFFVFVFIFAFPSFWTLSGCAQNWLWVDFPTAQPHYPFPPCTSDSLMALNIWSFLLLPCYLLCLGPAWGSSVLHHSSCPMSLPPQQYPWETTNQNQDIGCLFFK